MTYHTLAKNIAKNKSAAISWNEFLTAYMKNSFKLGSVQFTLNYVSLLTAEELWQEDELNGLGETFSELVKKIVKSDFSIEYKEEINTFRNELKDRMDCLMAYVDQFLIYEYVLNCVRYTFEDYDYKDYDDDEFAKELMNYIVKDKDQSNRKAKTMEVLKALPVRFTKTRFFEMVKDGFSIYEGGDYTTLKDFVYMLRTSAMLHQPERMAELFPALNEYSEMFASSDISSLNGEEYYKKDMALKECVDYLNNKINICTMIAEAVNQLYACVLSASYADFESEEVKNVKEIFEYTENSFRKDEPYEIDETLTGLLMKLEGIQEVSMEEQQEAEGYLDDIGETTFISSAGTVVEEEYDAASMIGLLLSSSYFADLDSETEERTATKEDVDALYEEFRSDMEKIIADQPKLKVRALMAAVIGYLPLMFGTADELHEHILRSLKSCTNLAEKMALVEKLEDLMNEDEWDQDSDL